MILSDKTILSLLREGTLSIAPLQENQIQPASVDIRLGDTFSVVEDSSTAILTLSQKMIYKEIHADKYLLLPGQFVLATTMEYISLPDNLTAFVEGRSSLGRMGLFIQNAGWVDPGFSGEITLVQKQQLPLFCIKIITYLDGGTQVYLGMGYKVIDFNTLGGYDEIKIGTWFMDIDDFNDESKRYKVVPTPYPTQNKVYVRE